VYAIVRCGGRQEKASVDDVLTVDKMAGEPGSSVTLPALLVIDDGTVVSDPAEVGRYTVSAEILGTVSGPKINMIQYRNKTGYKRRLGHRQRHTQLKITGITAENGGTSRSAGTTEAKPAARSGGTGAKSGGTGAQGKAGSGTRSGGTGSSRSAPARRSPAAARKPGTGGKPEATSQSPSAGQES
jgi:large subunit ribosomal protein L21